MIRNKVLSPIRVLVIAAHPDDEIACAGTLIKLIERGALVNEIVLTQAGEGKDKRLRKGESFEKVSRKRKEEMLKAAKFLGIKKVFFFDNEDLSLSYSKDLMLKVLGVVRSLKPDLVLLMNNADFHPDHRIAFEIGIEAIKWAATGIRPEMGKPHRVGMILQMGGMWPIRPDLMIDVTNQVEKKMRMFSLHGSQANDKAVNFEKAMMTIYGYQLRTSEGKMAEPFQFCIEFPSVKLIEL